ISDELNHASIIDGVRLCKAQRFRYKNNNMDDLRAKLEEAKDCRIKLIATDGVFSMDGIVANLQAICDLADEYDALVMVDDSHAVGFMGEHGHGTAEYCGVEGRVDIITGTFGKALGGASGGYTSGRKEIIALLRQRSRPYLFSNTVAPAICEATIAVLDLLDSDPSYRERLFNNTKIFAEEIGKLGLDVTFRGSPILPIMLYDEHKASEFAARAMEKGIYVVAFSYPVVPKGKARIRTQISAALTEADIRDIVAKFAEIKEEMGL
ncbi:MAG: aminotransferase class I/II-fold pyridoxal phosphate-dependent enzyme, partial [Clostridia bacterium]|nr:aminotransferase class I/II-fold pyridoxal phosphate-dependent enzyme [Clostridia bacterium]